MKPLPWPRRGCGSGLRGSRKKLSNGELRRVARGADSDRMNTTAGLTASTTATNASPRSAAGWAAGIDGGATVFRSTGRSCCASPTLGALTATANAPARTMVMATRKANFIQSLVRVIRNSKSEKGYCPLIHYSLIQIITPEGGQCFDRVCLSPPSGSAPECD